MALITKLLAITARYQELSKKLEDPSKMESREFAKTSKEYASLADIVKVIEKYNDATATLEESSEMMADSSIEKEIRQLAEEEYYEVKKKLPLLEKELQIMLLPKDEADDKNVIIEVRAGTGGEEAALFAAELLRMYQRYAERRNYKFEVLSLSETGIGGVKDASANISGAGAYGRLKFESGVHRVQRVPETESGGRVHTSAATIAILPEAEDFDVQIEEKDLRIDVFRASGPGGQSVNTTDSAVRITHIPTGVVVSQQDEKSQHKNKAKALKILRSRVYEAQRQKQQQELADSRKSMVGSGDRSERIRTYNFPQSRVSDHRINLTLYKIDAILKEGELDEVIDALIKEDQIEKLSNIND